MNQFERTQILLGEEAMARLAAARVALFGVGGVGGYVAEALCRSGVGAIDLYDDDRVSFTNLNRQIIATHRTIGQYKADVAAERLASINPDIRVRAVKMFYVPENADEVDLGQYDYIVDAIDTVAAKIELAVRAEALHVPIISAMGAGNKLDPTRFRVADVYETSVCPLARVMRRELKRRGVKKLRVVYSTEEPVRPLEAVSDGARRSVPGSTAFVPPAVGLIIAGEVVKGIALGSGKELIP